MNKRNVNYSMTAYTAEGYRHIVVNKRSGREWYIFSVRIPSTTRAAADDALERGNAYADKGDYDRAIADFTQALRINPNQPMRMITAALPMPTKGTMTGLSLTLPRHSG
jgi:tetratricopeptide (TPR) repeat protein